MKAETAEKVIPEKHKVPFGQKVAFGLGMLSNQMFPAAMGIFMVVLVQDLGFPGWMWGILFFLPRVFDSVTDPIMGFISDNTRSRFGRRRIYVFIGAIIMGISFWIMWQLYRENGVDYNFVYFLAWSIVFYLGLTIFSVPYVAMGYEMSDNFHERTNIMAIAQWIGQWAWVIAPWFWVVMYDPDWFPNADTATRTLAIWVGVICALLAMAPAVFIKTKSTKDRDDFEPLTVSNIGGSLKSILEGFKESFQIKAFRKLCISTFLIFNSFNTVASFTFFIVVYYLFRGDAAAAGVWPTLFGSVGALGTTFFVIPATAWISRKIGKRKAFLVCQGISLIGYILLWFLFVPGKPWLFLFALPFFSFGIGSLFTLMMSMTADVCDLDELKTGKRREGIFGAIYWWMVKFGFAIAGLATGAIMTLVGFDVESGSTFGAPMTGLRLFFSGLPITGTLIAMAVMYTYDLTEEKANEISDILEARKSKKEAAPAPYFYKKDKLLALTKVDVSMDEDPFGVNEKSGKELENEFKAVLNKGMHGLCFSPYLDGQNIGDQLSRDQVEKRMKVIAPYTKWVRSFSCTEGNQWIPEVAKENGLSTLVGAWIDDDKDSNEEEIMNLIDLANKGLVDIAAIGNECLLREELSEDEILEYINRVKQAVPSIKVGYVDAYYQMYTNPKIVEACDVVMINCYPFWEGYNAKHSLTYLQKMHEVVKSISGNKKVIISETGWPTDGSSVGVAEPSMENMMKYFINLNKWSKLEQVEAFYFSSFDESWKARHEGDVGARWGLWDKNEKLKVN